MAITLEYSVVAKCTPEQVWKKFENIEQWPWWNRVIGKAQWLEGEPWRPGSRFVMETVRPWAMTLRPVILESAPPNKVDWRGSGTLMAGENRFTFDARPDGTCLLKITGEFSGAGTLFWSDKVRSEILQMFVDWLGALKTEAEKLAREEVARS